MRPDEAQIGTAFVAQRLSTVGLARSSNRALGRRPLDGSRERSLASSGTVHSPVHARWPPLPVPRPSLDPFSF